MVTYLCGYEFFLRDEWQIKDFTILDLEAQHFNAEIYYGFKGMQKLGHPMLLNTSVKRASIKELFSQGSTKAALYSFANNTERCKSSIPCSFGRPSVFLASGLITNTGAYMLCQDMGKEEG